MHRPWNTHAQLPFSGHGYDRKTVHYRYFVLRRSIRLARPSSLAIYQIIFQILQRLFEV